VSKHFFSRRDLLRASLASAAIAATPAGTLASAKVVPPESQAGNAAAQTASQAREPLETLSATEIDTLEAIVAALFLRTSTDRAPLRHGLPTILTARWAARCRPHARRIPRVSPLSTNTPAAQKERHSSNRLRRIRTRC